MTGRDDVPTVATAEVREVSGRPGWVWGVCPCGDAGPQTTDSVAAGLWLVGHADGHAARGRGFR